MLKLAETYHLQRQSLCTCTCDILSESLLWLSQVLGDSYKWLLYGDDDTHVRLCQLCFMLQGNTTRRSPSKRDFYESFSGSEKRPLGN